MKPPVMHRARTRGKGVCLGLLGVVRCTRLELEPALLRSVTSVAPLRGQASVQPPSCTADTPTELLTGISANLSLECPAQQQQNSLQLQASAPTSTWSCPAQVVLVAATHFWGGTERQTEGDSVGPQPQSPLEVAPAWTNFEKEAPKPKPCKNFNPADPNLPTLPRLKLEASWRSSLDRSDIQITLVTQLSLDRQRALKLSCRMFRGVIAAAVYVAMVDGDVVVQDKYLSLKEAKQQMQALVDEVEAIDRCRLDLALYSEVRPTETEAGLYPVNALRNRALIMASTEAVLLLDSDFLVSGKLVTHYSLIERALKKNAVLVVAAFQPKDDGKDGETIAVEAAKGSKEAAVELYDSGALQQFELRKYAKAHNATNYPLWRTATKLYEIDYQQGFEPYVIVAREGLPWYDERFRGYFQDKSSFIHHLWAMGYKWYGHPTGYVVHLPHGEPRWKTVANSFGLKDTYADLARRIRGEMKAGAYTAVTTFTCEFPRTAAANPSRGHADAGVGPVARSMDRFNPDGSFKRTIGHNPVTFEQQQ